MDERPHGVGVHKTIGIQVDVHGVTSCHLGLVGDNHDAATHLTGPGGSTVELRHGKGHVVDVVGIVEVEVSAVGRHVRAPIRIERRAVLAAQAVATEVLVVGVVDRPVACDGAYLEGRGAVRLVQRQLAGGEEVAY